MTTQNEIITVSEYMRKPEAIQRFVELFGEQGARAYIQSILIEVTSDDKLRDCTPQSIYKSALRAASLGLSCDKSLKQAWLIPFNKNIGTRDNPKWVKEAQFIPHYKGLYTLAMRTGKYWQINVSPVYVGQHVLENTLTGLHAVRDENSTMIGKPDSFNAAYTDVTVRRKKDMKIIGWIGYFKTKKGFEKSVWMSSAEIDDHARKYVKDYDKNPNWNDAEKRPVMEMKTVLRQLLSWADMSGTENSQLAEALQADAEIVEGETSEVQLPETPEPETAGMNYDVAKQVTVETKKGEKFMGELDAETLNKILESEKTTDEQKQAALIVLATDFQMVAPAKPSTEKNLKELGF